MKKFISMILIFIFCVFMSGCGDVKTINGVTYDTYGIISYVSDKNPDIKYKVIAGNVIWSVILCETVIAPIYFIGWSIMEPVGVLDKNAPKGVIGYYDKGKN